MMKKLTSGLCVAALAILAPMSAMAVVPYNGTFDFDAINDGFLGHPLIDSKLTEGDDVEDIDAGDQAAFDSIFGPGTGAAILSQAGIEELGELYLYEHLFNETSAPHHADIVAKQSAAYTICAPFVDTASSGVGALFPEAGSKIVAAFAVRNPLWTAGFTFVSFGVSQAGAGAIASIPSATYLTASGDIDDDTITNLEEWQAAQAVGKAFEDLPGAYQAIVDEFILQATTPTTPPQVGDPVVPPLSAPVAGPLGLAILAGAVSLGGAMAVRRKK